VRRRGKGREATRPAGLSKMSKQRFYSARQYALVRGDMGQSEKGKRRRLGRGEEKLAVGEIVKAGDRLVSSLLFFFFLVWGNLT